MNDDNIFYLVAVGLFLVVLVFAGLVTLNIIKNHEINLLKYNCEEIKK